MSAIGNNRQTSARKHPRRLLDRWTALLEDIRLRTVTRIALGDQSRPM